MGNLIVNRRHPRPGFIQDAAVAQPGIAAAALQGQRAPAWASFVSYRSTAPRRLDLLTHTPTLLPDPWMGKLGADDALIAAQRSVAPDFFLRSYRMPPMARPPRPDTQSVDWVNGALNPPGQFQAWPAIEHQLSAGRVRARQLERRAADWSDDGAVMGGAAASRFFPALEAFWALVRKPTSRRDDWNELDSFAATLAPTFTPAMWPAIEAFLSLRPAQPLRDLDVRRSGRPGVQGAAFEDLTATWSGVEQLLQSFRAGVPARLEPRRQTFRDDSGLWPNALQAFDAAALARAGADFFTRSFRKGSAPTLDPRRQSFRDEAALEAPLIIFSPATVWPAIAFEAASFIAPGPRRRPGEPFPFDVFGPTVPPPFTAAAWPAIEFLTNAFRVRRAGPRPGPREGIPFDAWQPILPVPFTPAFWPALAFFLASERARRRGGKPRPGVSWSIDWIKAVLAAPASSTGNLWWGF